MPDPILDLSALAPERPQVRLRTEGDPDGSIYELAVPEDFGAVALAEFGRRVTELDQLWESPERDSAQDRRLEQLLDELACGLVRDAPPESVRALPAATKRSLAIRFFAGAGLSMANILQGLPMSESSPLASNGSTAETRSAGLT